MHNNHGPSNRLDVSSAGQVSHMPQNHSERSTAQATPGPSNCMDVSSGGQVYHTPLNRLESPTKQATSGPFNRVDVSSTERVSHTPLNRLESPTKQAPTEPLNRQREIPAKRGQHAQTTCLPVLGIQNMQPEKNRGPRPQGQTNGSQMMLALPALTRPPSLTRQLCMQTTGGHPERYSACTALLLWTTKQDASRYTLWRPRPTPTR